MRRLAALIACLLGLTVPAVSAQAQTAPPGNSGIDEYVETAPSASGGRSTRGESGGGGAPGAAATLPGDTRRALEAQGADGKRLAELLESEAANPRSSGAPRRSSAPLADGDGGDSAFEAIVQTATSGSSDGMGIVLPLILVGSLLLVLATALLRRRAAR